MIANRPPRAPEPITEPAKKPTLSATPLPSNKFTSSQASVILPTKIKAVVPKSIPKAIPKAIPQTIPKLKAMPAKQVRGEFEKAAEVLRRYFQSPVDEALQKLVCHPDQTMLRHRAWAVTRHIVPALPLQIGPQFGVSGNLLLTGVKLTDGSTRLAALENTDQGYRLDWESFSAWGECRFAELASNGLRPPALLRVTVKPSSATPPVTALGAGSFTLSHPDERVTLAAYATAEVLERTPAARRLRDASGGMFTLRLAVNEVDVKTGWAQILEVVATGWVPPPATAK